MGGIGNCSIGNIGMVFMFQMGMGTGWEWEQSHLNGRDLVGKICSRTSLTRIVSFKYCSTHRCVKRPKIIINVNKRIYC